VDHIRQALYSNLGRILSSILKDDLSERSMNSSQRRDELRSCLEVYDNIEAWQEAEKVVRDIVEKKIEGVSRLLGSDLLPLLVLIVFF
jgi:hypothetical protein